MADDTVAALIESHVCNRPDAPAIVVATDSILTFGVLGEQIALFGQHFKIRRSMRVAIMVPDGPGLAVSIVAVACNGVAVPLNPRLTQSEVDDLFSMLSIDALIV